MSDFNKAVWNIAEWNAPEQSAVPVVLPVVHAEYKSHLLQEMLNYFDASDVRVRENPVTVDAQFLNVFACELEEQSRKMSWLTDASRFISCPMNLDNRGVWYKAVVPQTSAAFTMVRGYLNNSWVVLREYDDLLPVPSRITVADEATIQLQSPVAFQLTGTGFVDSAAPGVLSFHNYLSLLPEGLGENFGGVELLIKGYVKSDVVGQRELTTETILIVDENPLSTINVWSEITEVVARGLPEGASITAYLFESAMPNVADVTREFNHQHHRDLSFPRFWSIDGRLLKETYLRNRFSGYEYAQSYYCPLQLTTVAVEPNTNGLFASDGTTLFYADRREPLPGRLADTGMSEEPYFNLLVTHEKLVNNIRYVQLEGLPASRSEQCHKFRYVVETPESEPGIMVVVGEGGLLLDYTPAAGWYSGPPKPVSLPLTESGTYLITLETADSNGIVTRESVPYGNFFFTPQATFDLSDVVPSIQAVVFDSAQRLWIWDGDQLIPMNIHYDAYTISRQTNQQFVSMTDQYDQIELS